MNAFVDVPRLKFEINLTFLPTFLIVAFGSYRILALTIISFLDERSLALIVLDSKFKTEHVFNTQPFLHCARHNFSRHSVEEHEYLCSKNSRHLCQNSIAANIFSGQLVTFQFAIYIWICHSWLSLSSVMSPGDHCSA